MGIRKPKDLPQRFHDIGEEFARHPLGSVAAFTLLGLFMAIPFLFLLYPAWLGYGYLKAEHWPETLAAAVVAAGTVVCYLTIWISSIGRLSYLVALTATLNFLIFNGTTNSFGMLFAVLSCAAVTVVGATVILLTIGLRK